MLCFTEEETGSYMWYTWTKNVQICELKAWLHVEDVISSQLKVEHAGKCPGSGPQTGFLKQNEVILGKWHGR